MLYYFKREISEVFRPIEILEEEFFLWWEDNLEQITYFILNILENTI